MKKHLCLALSLMFVNGFLFGQYTETLTNSSVIEMSKASLTDEVIINLIMYSPVRFDFEDKTLTLLKNEGVSDPVIEAMMGAHNLSKIYRLQFEKTDTTANVIHNESRPEVYNTEAKEYLHSSETETITVLTLNFVTPLTELIKFGDNEFKTFENAMAGWDKKVRKQTGDVYGIIDQMLQTEIELRRLKNIDIDLFSSDIIKNKVKLSIYRDNYLISKEVLKDLGQQVQKWLKAEMDDRTGNLSRNFNSVGQLIGSSESNPAYGENPDEMIFASRGVNESTSGYLIYATEILVWYQNWIKEIDTLIIDWNPRVSNIIREDERLRIQLDPVEKKIDELRVNSRQNRKELSTLKMKAREIEKARKELHNRMDDEKKDLTLILKEMNKTNQMSLKQRFTDIIENIGYTFEEKLGL